MNTVTMMANDPHPRREKQQRTPTLQTTMMIQLHSAVKAIATTIAITATLLRLVPMPPDGPAKNCWQHYLVENALNPFVN